MSKTLVFVVCFTTLTNYPFAQMAGDLRTPRKETRSESSLADFVGPYKFGNVPFYNSNSNPDCSSLNALDNNDPGNIPTDPNFSHMTQDWEFRLNFPSPNGTFQLVGEAGDGVPYVSGGMTENPALSITTTSAGSTMTSWTLNWPSASAVDRIVSAVIVKGGPNANVYTYPDLSSGDSGEFLTPRHGNEYPEISHISFCFEPYTSPSAAAVSISGRALAINGTGIANAQIELRNLSTGEIVRTITSPFGYYWFKGVNSEGVFVLTASHKRHQFMNNPRTFSLSEDLAGMDFVSAW